MEVLQPAMDSLQLHVLIDLRYSGVQPNQSGDLLRIFAGPVKGLQKAHAVGGQHHWKRALQGGQHAAVFLYHSVYISGGICQAAVSIAEFGGDEDRVPWAQSVRQRGILQSGEQNVGTGQNEKGCLLYTSPA